MTMPIPRSQRRPISLSRRPQKSTSIDARPLLFAACSLHGAVRRRSPEAGALIRCVVSAQQYLGLPDAALPAFGRQDGDCELTTTEWARLGEALAKRLARLDKEVSYLEAWMPSIARTIGLTGLESMILGLAIAYNMDSHLERLWDELCDARGRAGRLCVDPDVFSLLLAEPSTEIRSALAADGRLRSSGVLMVDEDGDIAVLRRLSGLLARRTPHTEDVRELLLSPTRSAELPWDAFAHLGEQAEIAAKVLAAALAIRESGVGILLYGPPGTGKTTFAATLAQHVGAALHAVGEADSRGKEPTRGERLGELRLNQSLLGEGASVLLFDEAEDLFPSSPFERPVGSRVFLHRLIEGGRAPVIWTANNVETLGPAMARRMMLCIEMRQPSLSVRGGLWQDMAKAEGVTLTHLEAADLARMVPAAPAVMRNALRAARLAGGGAATARTAASGIARAVYAGHMPTPEQAPDPDYDPALLRADIDLAALANRLSLPGTTRAVSLLLSGPPGSGKSAYARYLAQRMGLPVLQKRASDLLGQYVGESEQNIAAAFAEARDTNAFLVFDEADSLLADRRGARRGWEVTQVNEMLTWMEEHKLPFACTTNLPDHLDAASMRRFLLKLRFGYLRPPQAELAFTRFFGGTAPSSLARLENLTPADFALVRRRAKLMTQPTDAEVFISLLAAEIAGRDGERRMGFSR